MAKLLIWLGILQRNNNLNYFPFKISSALLTLNSSSSKSLLFLIKLFEYSINFCEVPSALTKTTRPSSSESAKPSLPEPRFKPQSNQSPETRSEERRVGKEGRSRW